jgi:hypothetical protein
LINAANVNGKLKNNFVWTQNNFYALISSVIPTLSQHAARFRIQAATGYERFFLRRKQLNSLFQAQ